MPVGGPQERSYSGEPAEPVHDDLGEHLPGRRLIAALRKAQGAEVEALVHQGLPVHEPVIAIPNRQNRVRAKRVGVLDGGAPAHACERRAGTAEVRLVSVERKRDGGAPAGLDAHEELVP